MKIEINHPDLVKGIENLVETTGYTAEEIAECLLVASLARKAAWGDALKIPEPGLEFIQHRDGGRVIGEELYRKVYDQVRGWINSLLLAERLVIALVEIAQKQNLLHEISCAELKKAANRYAEKFN
jgi:hypothetical protein